MKLNSLYELRKSFSIIGVTGRTGSGCTKFSQILEQNFRTSKQSIIRDPNDMNHRDYNRDFRQIYKIAYNFCASAENWKLYKRIEYKNILYSLMIIEWTNNPNLFDSIIDAHYEQEIKDLEIDLTELKGKIKSTLYAPKNIKAIEILSKLHPYIFKGNDDKEGYLEAISRLNDAHSTNELFDDLNSILSANYLARTYLLHHVAYNYRTFSSAIEGKKSDDIYFIIRFINQIIKAYRNRNKNNGCHIVIDSLRNSMEIMFLKERYSAFYMVAIKGQNRYNRLKRRIERISPSNQNYKDQTQKIITKLLDLDATEYRCGDFKKGDLASPDVQNCISQSDIHLFNTGITQKLKPQNDLESEFETKILKDSRNTFFTLAEQTMKLQALIQQPGIITPSPLERCMQTAYSAKLNSGCISRQVGAVVTDQKYAVKAIGWNDVPSENTPCKLRDVRDLMSNQNPDLFTDFERGKGLDEYELTPSTSENSFLKQNDSEGFHEYLKSNYSGIDESFKSSGKPCSFCFKTAYNKFSGEDNQVHTRSLHAEENAMLQISKHGGQPLKNGYLFTTASTCELCAKKAFQLGVKKIFYIDPYPGISMSHVLKNHEGKNPELVFFQGAVGRAFHKLYEPFLAYKDELMIETGVKLDEPIEVQKKELNSLLKQNGGLSKKQEHTIDNMSKTDFEGIISEIKQKLGRSM